MASMGGNSITIDVGVRLQPIRGQIEQFQNLLSKLQPNTTAYKELDKIIRNMTAGAQGFAEAANKGFANSSDLRRAEKDLNRIEDAALHAQTIIGDLNFSDIQLTGPEANQLQAITDELDNIQRHLEATKEAAKQSIFGDQGNLALLGNIDPRLFSRSFDEIEAAIERKIPELQAKIASLLQDRSSARNTADLGERLMQGINAQDWGQFLNRSGTGFATGGLNNRSGKQEFLAAIQQMFTLTDQDIDFLRQMTFNDLNQYFAGLENSTDQLAQRFRQAIANATSRATRGDRDIGQAQNQLQSAEQVRALMGQASGPNGVVGQEAARAQSEIQLQTNALNHLQQQVLSNVTANGQLANSYGQTQGALNQLRGDLGQVTAEMSKQQNILNTLNGVQSAITNFLGFNHVLGLVKKGVNEALNHIKQLDKTMNGIAIVTNMTTADLWDQVGVYTEMAQKYGTSIQGAYEVSKIYYQAGYDTADVMVLMDETLKLSKISGLDYAKTTDYMMTALRGFKMEVSEASTVVDVYSNLAANTAVSQEELAVAMSKTASAMEGVGATFEEASAMIATMQAVTRESATNIGTAMKSIASRYGEMKKDPLAMKDSEGEFMDYNKVDTALKSVGISLKDANGQFRDFTDVILELTEVWDDLESTQQRYIATQFAGNRCEIVAVA